MRAIADGRGNQYPPAIGISELRTAVAGHQLTHYGLEFDPADEVLVTVGATEAIAAAVLGLTLPGDEVITFEPYYDSYAACIELAGARRRVVTLRREETGWGFDPEELRAAVTPASRLILLNTPHNPTGKIFSPAELQLIADIAIEHDLIVVADEVYEHLTFDAPHVPIATLPGMAQRCVTISSAGKTFSVTGWKVGWACGPAPFIAALRSVKQFLTYVGSGPFQYAIAEALTGPSGLYTDYADALRSQRDLFVAGLAELGFVVHRPQATYFATIDLGSAAQQWCEDLVEVAGVVAIPTRVFYDSDIDRYARFAFCKRPDVLRQALSRLKRVA